MQYSIEVDISHSEQAEEMAVEERLKETQEDMKKLMEHILVLEQQNETLKCALKDAGILHDKPTSIGIPRKESSQSPWHSGHSRSVHTNSTSPMMTRLGSSSSSHTAESTSLASALPCSCSGESRSSVEDRSYLMAKLMQIEEQGLAERDKDSSGSRRGSDGRSSDRRSSDGRSSDRRSSDRRSSDRRSSDGSGHHRHSGLHDSRHSDRQSGRHSDSSRHSDRQSGRHGDSRQTSRPQSLKTKDAVITAAAQSASSSTKLARYTPMISSKDRFITDVAVLGYTHRRGANVYVINTTYSDRDRFEIYRRYGEFFSFQNTLRQLFPKVEVPVLPTIDNVLSILGRTNSERVLKSRLNTINSYCQTILLHLPYNITKSLFVQSFFRPNPGDRQLDRLRRPRGETLMMSVYPQQVPAGSAFEEHVVIADHEASNGNELSVKAGDVVRVINKSGEAAGWWLVSKVDQKTKKGGEKLGYIPGAFVRPYEGQKELETTAEVEEKYLGFVSSVALVEELNPSLKYIVTEDYMTYDPRQISLCKGTDVIVIEKSADGWWLVSQGNREGWAPASYLEPLGGDRMEREEDKTEQGIFEISMDLPSQESERYVSSAAYSAEMEDEVSFPENVTIEVIQKNTSGWWRVRYGQCVGIAPASFLTLASATSQTPATPEEKKDTCQLKMDENQLFDFGHSMSGIDKPPPRRKWVTDSPHGRRQAAALATKKVLFQVKQKKAEKEKHCCVEEHVDSYFPDSDSTRL